VTQDLRHVGQPLTRREDQRLLTGRGRFVDDIRLPGMLVAHFLRSPHAHARIRSIDVAAAAAAPGVHAAWACADLPPPLNGMTLPSILHSDAIRRQVTPRPLAKDEVCYVGEPVAVVFAESRYQAEDAAELIEVDYEPLPVAADCKAALAPGAAPAHVGQTDNLAAEKRFATGDVGAAFARAAKVVRAELFQHRGCAQPMETRGLVARPGTLDEPTVVWAAVQTNHGIQRGISFLLGLDPKQLRFITPDIGGGFGPKGYLYQEYPVVIFAARQFGRPVKWIEDRREHFVSTTQERDVYADVELALDADARILGLRGGFIYDVGAFNAFGTVVPDLIACSMMGPYRIEAFDVTARVAFTNKVMCSPVRGAGRPQGVFMLERLLDKATAAFGLDRAEIRARNLLTPADLPWNTGLVYRDGQPMTYDTGDYPRSQQTALEMVGWADFPARREAARREGRLLGIGFASFTEGTGLGPFETAVVKVLPTGKIRVATGSSPHGQGHETTYAQVCAEVLQTDPAQIEVICGDTAHVELGVGTFASRSAVNSGSAIHLAAQAFRTRALELAAALSGQPAETLDLKDGTVVSTAPGSNLALPLLYLEIQSTGRPGFALPPGVSPGLQVTASFAPPQATYGNGTQAAVVEVDPETGVVTILDLVMVHDSGRIINPLLVDGQVQGAVVHGVGNALYEHMLYDDEAQPLTTSFADYLLPCAVDAPIVRQSHLESPTPLNPLGVKGAGEGGTIPAPAAIVSAIEHALSDFGVTLDRYPLSPQAIVAAIGGAAR
jgi:carbon-monoxide dehydrogenase large subunit